MWDGASKQRASESGRRDYTSTNDTRAELHSTHIHLPPTHAHREQGEKNKSSTHTHTCTGCARLAPNRPAKGRAGAATSTTSSSSSSTCACWGRAAPNRPNGTGEAACGEQHAQGRSCGRTGHGRGSQSGCVSGSVCGRFSVTMSHVTCYAREPDSMYILTPTPTQLPSHHEHASRTPTKRSPFVAVAPLVG